MGRLTVLLLTALICLPLAGQPDYRKHEDEERPQTTLFANFLGQGSLLSVNYDRLLLSGNNILLSAAAGIGMNNRFQDCLGGDHCDEGPNNFLNIPHHVTLLVGKGAHFLELGAGATVVLGNTGNHYIPYPMAGYRLHPRRKGSPFLRLTFSYPSRKKLNDIVYVPFGASIGVSF